MSHRAAPGQGWTEIPGAAVDSQKCQQNAGSYRVRLGQNWIREYAPLQQGLIFEALALGSLFHLAQEAQTQKEYHSWGTLKGAFQPAALVLCQDLWDAKSLVAAPLWSLVKAQLP